MVFWKVYKKNLSPGPQNPSDVWTPLLEKKCIIFEAQTQKKIERIKEDMTYLPCSKGHTRPQKGDAITLEHFAVSSQNWLIVQTPSSIQVNPGLQAPHWGSAKKVQHDIKKVLSYRRLKAPQKRTVAACEWKIAEKGTSVMHLVFTTFLRTTSG